jgi:hypothetical protein
MILTIGFWLANVAHGAIRRGDTTNSQGLGLGGREAAGKQMEYWMAKLRKER